MALIFKTLIISFSFYLLTPATTAWGYLELLPASTQELVRDHKTDHTYVGKGGTKNFYSKFSVSTGTFENPLIIITGLEDPIPLWFEVVEKMLRKGFKTVYIVDLRGQGQSQRVLDDGKLLYVERFDDYTHDIIAFFDHIKSEITNSPYILSHSTGSTVITNSLAQIKSQFPKMIPIKMSFWAPLVKLNISSFLNNSIMRSVLGAIDLIALTFNCPIKVKSYGLEKFEDTKLTTSPERHKLIQAVKHEGGLVSDGLTLHWVLQGVKGAKHFREQSFKDITMPTLVLKAEKEAIVINDYELNNNKISTVTINGAKHALHSEKDIYLNESVNKTFDFFLKK